MDAEVDSYHSSDCAALPLHSLVLNELRQQVSAGMQDKLSTSSCVTFAPGSFMPHGPPNGTNKPGLHTAGYPMPRVPIPPYHGGPQPYTITTRGAIHGPVSAVPHVPQPGSRGFGAGRGSAGAPIGSHLPHKQGSQQPIRNIGSNFNFPALESPSSQPSVGGPLSRICF